jgi:hypothetical protein
VLDVCPDRLRADHELSGDLGLRASLGEKREYLMLPRAEPRFAAVAVTVPMSVHLGRHHPTKRALDPREELRRVERLRHVIVGAEHQPGRAVESIDLTARDEDHG